MSKNIKKFNVMTEKMVDSIVQRLTTVEQVTLPLDIQITLTDIVNQICKDVAFPSYITLDEQWVVVYHILCTLRSIERPEEIFDADIREQARRVVFDIPLRALSDEEHLVWIKRRKYVVAGLCNRKVLMEDGTMKVRPITVSLDTHCSPEEDVVWFWKTREWVVGLGMGESYPDLDIMPSMSKFQQQQYEDIKWDPFVGIQQ